MISRAACWALKKMACLVDNFSSARLWASIGTVGSDGSAARPAADPPHDKSARGFKADLRVRGHMAGREEALLAGAGGTKLGSDALHGGDAVREPSEAPGVDEDEQPARFDPEMYPRGPNGDFVPGEHTTAEDLLAKVSRPRTSVAWQDVSAKGSLRAHETQVTLFP